MSIAALPGMRTIVIDPGHGGDVPCGGSSPFGVRGRRGTLEKDVMLALARRVRERVDPRLEVLLTRDGDQNRSLAERAALARQRGADAFVSLHANAGAAGLFGCETWVHPRATSTARALAALVERSLSELVGQGRGVHSGELALLNPDQLGPRTDGCLVEIDYLTSEEGESRLRDGDRLDAIASALAQALEEHLGVDRGAHHDGDDRQRGHDYLGAARGNARRIGDRARARALEEPTVDIDDGVVISDNAVACLKLILTAAGLDRARITSGRRSSTDQARAMYQLLEGHGAQYGYDLYGAYGDQVIDVYVARKKQKATAAEIRRDMRDKIVELGPSNVSHHCSDDFDVFDVAPSSLADTDAFDKALKAALARGDVDRIIVPPKDPAFHIEIKLLEVADGADSAEGAEKETATGTPTGQSLGAYGDPSGTASRTTYRWELTKDDLVRAHPDMALVKRHLAGVPGSTVSLILRGNEIPASGEVDVLVHMHGYSDDLASMSLRSKEAFSGLDFLDPEDPDNPRPQRGRPTLAILPRGRYAGGEPKGDGGKKDARAYEWQAFDSAEGLHEVIDFALAHAAAQVGRSAPLTPCRLILTAHSGGGAGVSSALGHTNADEVQLFDATYLWAKRDNFVTWMKVRLEADAALVRASSDPYLDMLARGSSLRVIYISGSPTEGGAKTIHDALAAELQARPDVATTLAPFYRVEGWPTKFSMDHHNGMPRLFGWQLLWRAAGDLDPECARPGPVLGASTDVQGQGIRVAALGGRARLGRAHPVRALDDNRYQFEQSETVRLHIADSLSIAETSNDPKYYARIWYDSNRVNFGVASWTGAHIADLLDTYTAVAAELGAEDRLHGFFGDEAAFTAIRDRFRDQGAGATLTTAEENAFKQMGNDVPLREAQRRKRAEDVKADLDAVGNDGKYPWIDAYMNAISELAAHVLVHARHQHGGVTDLIQHVIAQHGGDDAFGTKMVDGSVTETDFLKGIGARVVELVAEKYRDGVRARYKRLVDTYDNSGLAYFFSPRAVDAPLAEGSAFGSPLGRARAHSPATAGRDESYRRRAGAGRTSHAGSLSRRYGGWANDGDSVDYRHVVALGPSTDVEFSLDASTLANLCLWNAFDVTPAEGTDVVLFGLRGCRLVEGSGYDGSFANTVRLVEDLPDHEENHCVLGVWAVAGSNAGLIAVVPGSTVPKLRAMQKYMNNGPNTNMMLTGRYLYSVGDHRGDADPLHLKGVFRQGQRIVVLRSRADDTYDTLDTFDLATPGDNIHPSRDTSGERFSSEGCQTVRGGGDPAGAQLEHRPGPGWVRFREAAGLTPRRARAAEDGRRFTYVLLTGREARLATNGATASELQRLRQGSSGAAVRALQTVLADTSVPATRRYSGPIDGTFDGGTAMAWVKYQQARDAGAADCIVTPADATVLGFDIASGAPLRPPAFEPDPPVEPGEIRYASGRARRRARYAGGPAYRVALRGDASDPARAELARIITTPHATPATMNDLVLRANFDPSGLTNPAVDVVLHFHGYSSVAGGAADVEHDKEPASGLDFEDPVSGTAGRAYPTLAILPRGLNAGMVYKLDKETNTKKPTGLYAFKFPGLDNAGTADLIEFALGYVSRVTAGLRLVPRRIILTAHSGGGAALDRAIELPSTSNAASVDPHEVHLYDALYGAPPNVAAWARVHMDNDARALRAAGGIPDAAFTAGRAALRAFFIRASHSATVANTSLHDDLKRWLEGPYAAAAPELCPYFRVESNPSWTGGNHAGLAQLLGWQLLADPSATPSGVARPSAIATCAAPSGDTIAWADLADDDEAPESLPLDPSSYGGPRARANGHARPTRRAPLTASTHERYPRRS